MPTIPTLMKRDASSTEQKIGDSTCACVMYDADVFCVTSLSQPSGAGARTTSTKARTNNYTRRNYTKDQDKHKYSAHCIIVRMRIVSR